MLDGMYVKSIGIRDGIDQEESYIARLPAVMHLRSMGGLVLRKKVTFFVGENGTGKSTLLEALAVSVGFNAEGGSRNYRFQTKATESLLHRYLTVSRTGYQKDGFLQRAESFYNAASYLDLLDEIPAGGPRVMDSYGGVSLHCQSHGESFMALVENRFGENGLYILDEPEAALSPVRQMSLLSEFHRLVRAGSQLLIATHSPILMAYPDSEIYELREDGIYLTPYEQTSHYQLMRRFLNHPQKMLQDLLDE